MIKYLSFYIYLLFCLRHPTIWHDFTFFIHFPPSFLYSPSSLTSSFALATTLLPSPDLSRFSRSFVWQIVGCARTIDYLKKLNLRLGCRDTWRWKLKACETDGGLPHKFSTKTRSQFREGGSGITCTIRVMHAFAARQSRREKSGWRDFAELQSTLTRQSLDRGQREVQQHREGTKADSNGRKIVVRRKLSKFDRIDFSTSCWPSNVSADTIEISWKIWNFLGIALELLELFRSEYDAVVPGTIDSTFLNCFLTMARSPDDSICWGVPWKNHPGMYKNRDFCRMAVDNTPGIPGDFPLEMRLVIRMTRILIFWTRSNSKRPITSKL